MEQRQLLAVPNAPFALTAAASGQTSVNLSFYDNSDNETGFVVQRATSANGTYTKVATVGVAAGVHSQVKYTDTTASPGTTYYYEVYATSGSGNSSIAGPVSATTSGTSGGGGTTVPPNGPFNLTASALSATSVQVSFIDNANNETNFIVERGTSSSGPFTQVGNVGAATGTGATVTFTDTTAAASTTYYYRAYAQNSAGNSLISNVGSVTTPAGTGGGGGTTEGAFGGTPTAIPGRIEAENYDTGGEGVAYHDSDTVNSGGAYRTTEGVDVETTGDTGGGYDVGWAHTGEYLKYTVNVTTAGNYDLAIRTANASAGGAFHVEVDGVNVTGSLAVPNTGAFQTYTNVSKTGIALTAGQHVVKLVMDANSSNGFVGNFNYLQFTASQSGGGGGGGGSSTPFTGTPAPLPGKIEIENFDKGGQGVAYNDTDTTNSGGAYRTTEGVDIEPTTDAGGGYDVGWAHAGEWLKYTVNVTTAGTYDLDMRVANVGAGGAFHLEVDGTNVTGTLAVPNTGGFQTYTDVVKTGISLTAGQHVLRLVMDGNSSNGFSGNFNWMKLTAETTQTGNWVPYANLIGQSNAAADFPSVTGAGVTVAVIDRGIDTATPQLAGKVITGYNFRDNNSNYQDDYGHGTGVAGIIAASGYTYNGQYNQGVAPGVNLISLKQESSAGVKSALDWVIANAKTYNIQVVNLTDFVTDVLPNSFDPGVYLPELQTLHDMGIFISTPVGNGEVQYGPNVPIGYPALSPYLTAVGGIDLTGGMYADSLRGPAMDVLGPASNVTMPYYLKNPNSTGYDQYDDNYDGTPLLVNYAQGTSWASAYTAGVAALIKQVSPLFTPDQIQQILKDSGTPTLDPENNVYYPLINVDRALALAYQRIPTQTQPGTMTLGANVDTSKVTGSESTGQIAVNPTNPNNLVIVSQSNDGGGALLPVSRSTDGGKTWTTTLVGPQDGQPSSYPRPDAHVAFDSFGNLYLTYMVGGGASGEIRLAVLRSTDGGASFSSLGFAVSGTGFNPDAPWIATGVDETNPSLQHVWISFTDYNSNRVMIVGGTSGGLGQFNGWSAPKTVSQGFGAFSSVAVDAAGHLVVGWQSTDSGSVVANNLMVNYDATGTGNSFSPDTWMANTNVGGLDPIPAQPTRTIDAEGRLAFDTSNDATKGRLYLVYTDQTSTSGSNTDIYLKYSDNLGATWSSPVKVNDDNTANSQFLPAIAVDPTTGNVGISWLDARNSGNNTGVQLFSTVSIDHGVSVKPNVQVSAGTSFQSLAGASSNDLDFGDSGGVVFNAGKLIPVWSDNSNSAGGNPDGSSSKFDIYADVITVA